MWLDLKTELDLKKCQHHNRFLKGLDETQHPLGVVSKSRVSMLRRKHMLPYFIHTFGIQYNVSFQFVHSLRNKQVILVPLMSCSTKCATELFQTVQQVKKKEGSAFSA